MRRGRATARRDRASNGAANGAASGTGYRAIRRPGAIIAPLIAIVLLLGAVRIAAAPRANLWPFWDAHNAESEQQVAHDEWDGFLARHLTERDGITRIAYGAIPAADRAALDQYIDRLSRTAVRSLARDEQRAFWINLYNALTIQVVLEHYPTKSIRNIPPQPLPLGPWNRKLITIERQRLTLNDIEHRILRPIWRDPRVHYAINCASIGCPNIAERAFTAANTERMLDAAAIAFINHPRGVSVQNGKLRVSSIYHWFSKDFGANDGEVIAHLRRYARPPLLAQLKNIDKISGHEYDWSLNE